MFKILKRIQGFPIELLSEVRITGTVGMKEGISFRWNKISESSLLRKMQSNRAHYIQTPSSGNKYVHKIKCRPDYNKHYKFITL